MDNMTLKDVSDVEIEVSLSIPAAEVDKRMDEFFTIAQKDAEAPGFRKGKVPIDHLRRLYRERALPAVSQAIVSEYYAKLMKDHNLSPIGNPVIKDLSPNAKYIGKFGFDNSYSVMFTVEVLPRFDPQGYMGLELTFPKLDPNLIYERKLLEVCEKFAAQKTVTDRGIQLGDKANIDFVGYLDGVAFDGGGASGYTMNKVGSSNFIPGFEEQMVGIKVGESKKIQVTFPESYHAQHLAGKAVEFDVKLNSLVEVTPALMDDELAVMNGLKDMAELKAKVLKEAEDDNNMMVRQFLDQQIFTKLSDINHFTCPKTLFDSEVERLKKLLQQRNQPMTDEIMKELVKAAEYNVKRALIIESIYNKETAVEITPDELSALLDKQAAIEKKTKDELISALYNANQMDNFVSVLRSSKVIEYIVKNAVDKEAVQSVVVEAVTQSTATESEVSNG